MARPIPIGVRGEADGNRRTEAHTRCPSSELPPVYSTPDMIRLMETAGFNALQPFCDEGEITVGISINIEHRAASGIGMQHPRRSGTGIL
jgi:predicted thioesterase